MSSLLLLIVVVVVLARAVVVVRPPPFSSSEAEEADFARRNDSSAVTVKRARFETSPRVTSESLPSVVVVVVACLSRSCSSLFLLSVMFHRAGNREARYSLGKK